MTGRQDGDDDDAHTHNQHNILSRSISERFIFLCCWRRDEEDRRKDGMMAVVCLDGHALCARNHRSRSRVGHSLREVSTEPKERILRCSPDHHIPINLIFDFFSLN